MRVLQMSKELGELPVANGPSDLTIRPFSQATDIEPWLALRDRAFGRERIGIRSWDAGDFEDEFLGKPWWRPERFWIAEIEATLVGAVTLARRGSNENGVAAVHWLMVHPAARRRGVATALMASLEQAVWLAGERRIVLETHAGWERAVAFYEQCGYFVEAET